MPHFSAKMQQIQICLGSLQCSPVLLASEGTGAYPWTPSPLGLSGLDTQPFEP